MFGRALTAAVAALALAAASAHAAPPPNDAAGAASPFSPYTAENGTPREQQAIAELVEATADAGVPPCLGRLSFARTVWYRIPEVAQPQLIDVEAMGRTLDVVDLAAFVQPEIPPPPPPPPPPLPPPAEPTPTPTATPVPARSAQVTASEPNACAGVGAGGSDAAEEPTSGLSLRVPPNHPVLIQVGRRGTPGSPDDERAVLSLAAELEVALVPPPGDRANTLVPAARNGAVNFVDLAGASITGEDPAQPACPSLGTVWRRFVPGRSGKRLITVTGSQATTLTVFSGARPTGDNVLDCVNRERRGALQMVVPVTKRRTVWVRVGTDTPPEGAEAKLYVQPTETARVIDGGRGGFDPTTGGPGGGFPAACLRARVEDARVTGRRLSGTAAAMNRFRRVPVSIVVQGASICDAEASLFGPRGRLYARGRAVRLTGRRKIRLPRLRTFKRGSYRLRITGVNLRGERVTVRTRLRGRLG